MPEVANTWVRPARWRVLHCCLTDRVPCYSVRGGTPATQGTGATTHDQLHHCAAPCEVDSRQLCVCPAACTCALQRGCCLPRFHTPRAVQPLPNDALYQRCFEVDWKLTKVRVLSQHTPQ